MKEILNIGVTLIEIVVIPLFGCVYNAIWDQLCCYLDELSMLIGDVKLRIIGLYKLQR